MPIQEFLQPDRSAPLQSTPGLFKHPLNVDTLMRISYLIGVFKALTTLHARPLADQWVRLPNSNRIIGGLSPLEYMKKGGTLPCPVFAGGEILKDEARI